MFLDRVVKCNMLKECMDISEGRITILTMNKIKSKAYSW
jgi:hypothetical protein